MKKLLSNKVFITLTILFGIVLSAKAQTQKDSIIMAAMKDELTRNIKFLADDEFAPPFFIAYSLADAKITYASASLGALNTSGERSYKDWNVRVMVGDYQLNDENFVSAQPGDYSFEGSVKMPLDADYYGIRRSFWLTTNNVYNSAARTYHNKVTLLEHQKLDSSTIDIPDFSRAPLVKIMEPSPSLNYSKEQLENMVRTLSAEFDGNADIHNSMISATVFESTVFFVNSEGTEVQYPLVISTLSVNARTMADDSDRISRSLSYVAKTPEDLPSLGLMKADIALLIDHIKELRSSPRFDEEYSGPVLYLGGESAKVFGQVLFSGSNSLIAAREELHSNTQMNVFYSKNPNGLESKIEKLVISKDFTVLAEPSLSEFMSVPLIGSFKVDAEGVTPPDSLVLIKEGILKTLLNNRTPSRNILHSNGHNRFSYSYSGLSSEIGPGVIHIESEKGESLDNLKQKLIEKAEEAGLEYVIVIRPLETESTNKPRIVSRIWIDSGKEEIIRSARIGAPDMRNLKHPLGYSNSSIVLNTLWAGYGGDGSTGIPVSFIAPDALLVDDIEVSSFQKALTSMLPIIDNPVSEEKVTVSSP